MEWSSRTGVNAAQQNKLFLEWLDHSDRLLRKIARVYAPAGEAADLYQDLLITLWEAAPHYRGDSAVSTFVCRVAFNRAMNWSRAERTYQQRHVAFDESIAHPATGGEHDEQARRVRWLYKAIGALPAAERSLALLYLEEVPYHEMAEVLGISESNVGVRLHRLKKRLAEELARQEPGQWSKNDES